MKQCIQIIPNPIFFFDISIPNNMQSPPNENVSCWSVGWAFGGIATHLSSDICRCAGILNTAMGVPNNESETEGWIEFNVYIRIYNTWLYIRQKGRGHHGEGQVNKKTQRKDGDSPWVLWDSSAYAPPVHTHAVHLAWIYWVFDVTQVMSRDVTPHLLKWLRCTSAFGVSFRNVKKGAELKQSILKIIEPVASMIISF